MVTDEEALAAVRSVPHPRGRCGCGECQAKRDAENNREAWAVVRGRSA